MTKFIKHYEEPAVYFAGPDDNWRTTVAGITRDSDGDYDAPKEAKFGLAGPQCACNDKHGPNELFVTERISEIRGADFVFGYLKDAMDYMTIGEISFAVAMGVDVYLAVGPRVSEGVLAAFEFLDLDDATRVANDHEAKSLFKKVLNEVVKWENRKFFTIEEDEPEIYEDTEKHAA